MGQVGASDASLNQIADRAGVTKGALQHHYRSKADLFAEIVEHGWATHTDRLGAIGTEGSIEQRVGDVVENLREAYTTPAAVVAFLISSHNRRSAEPDPRQCDIFRSSRELMDELWAEIFADAPTAPARMIGARHLRRAQLLGLHAHPQVNPDAVESKIELELLKESLCHLLTTTS